MEDVFNILNVQIKDIINLSTDSVETYRNELIQTLNVLMEKIDKIKSIPFQEILNKDEDEKLDHFKVKLTSVKTNIESRENEPGNRRHKLHELDNLKNQHLIINKIIPKIETESSCKSKLLTLIYKQLGIYTMEKRVDDELVRIKPLQDNIDRMQERLDRDAGEHLAKTLKENMETVNKEMTPTPDKYTRTYTFDEILKTLKRLEQLSQNTRKGLKINWEEPTIEDVLLKLNKCEQDLKLLQEKLERLEKEFKSMIDLAWTPPSPKENKKHQNLGNQAPSMTETWNINNNKETILNLTSDSRICIVIPPNTFPDNTQIKTQVTPVQLDKIKDVPSGKMKSNLVGCTAILEITAPTANDIVQVTIPIETIEDAAGPTNVHVMANNNSEDKWSNYRGSDVQQEGQMTNFGVKEVLNGTGSVRLMVLRLKQQSKPEWLPDIAKTLDSLFESTICAFVVKQDEDTPGIISMNCVKRECVKDTIDELHRQGFTKGPLASNEFRVQHSQVLQVISRPNITFDNKSPVIMTFKSDIDSAKTQGFISGIPSARQAQYEEYRGFLSLYKCKITSDGSYYVDKKDATSMLCEVVITLPKGKNLRPPLHVPRPTQKKDGARPNWVPPGHGKPN